MQQILSTVDKRVAELNELQPISLENKQKLDKKFRLEFNYNSNHLEGNTLTYSETELLLLFDDTKGHHTLREYEEMKAHDVAYHLIEQWANDRERPLTEQNIKNLNEVILIRPFWKEAITADGQSTRRQILVGNYKEYPNSVRLANGEIFEYTSPADTPIEMEELMQWYRKEEGSLHPVTLAAMLHYKFVRIHPFDDGNGRIARLLLNYVLLKNNLPPVVIKSADKNNYLRALHLADTGDYAAFIEYIAEQLLWSINIFIKAAKGESIEEENDFSKELHLIEKKLKQKEHEAEQVIHFSETAVWDVLEEFYFPLVKTLMKEVEPAEKFFSQRMSSNRIFKGYKGPDGLHLNSVQRGTSNPQILDFVRNAKMMRFEYELMSPKNPHLNIPSWKYELDILFNESDYKLFSPLLTKVYPYSDYPKEDESAQIVDDFKNTILNKIKGAI